jgi:capsular exopolysaccharide synthesis family protein
MSEIENKYQADEIQIDFFDILRNLVRDCWLIVIFGLSVAMCSNIIANLLYKPSYSTSATFVVTSKGSNDTYSNLSSAITVAETFRSIFASTILENKVAADLGLKELSGKISAEVIPETNLLELVVSAPKPDIAYRTINSVMDNYTSVTSNVFDSVILDVMEAPELPTYPDNYIDTNRIRKIAFGLGSAAMAALLAALSILRDNIKNEKEVTKKLDTKLFGVIYHENKYKTLRSRVLRRKKSILITSPTVSYSFVDSIKKIRAKFEYKASQKDSNVLLVTSVLENEGKSTFATNLALALAQKSFNVLLVDADFHKPSIYKILQKDVEVNQEFGDCVSNMSALKDSLIFDENSGLYLLIGSKLYKNSTDIITTESFQKFITSSKKIMDYVIIDSPPISVSADTELLADIVDVSLLVVKQSTARTKDINDAIDLLTGSNSELLGCIYNNAQHGILGNWIGYGYKYSYQGYYGYHDNKSTSHS